MVYNDFTVILIFTITIRHLHFELMWSGIDYGDRTNFAYCPPAGEFGTIEAYVWNCKPGPSGEGRGKIPYWSNPNVKFEGVATGSPDENNANYIKEKRFESASAGTNCLDGNPDEAWMQFKPTGSIGNNCPNGEASYELPLASSTGNSTILKKCAK